MNAQTRNGVLNSLAGILSENKSAIVAANKADLTAGPPDDPVIVDRLKVTERKVETMIESVLRVAKQADPARNPISSYVREDGLRIENRKVPFGTVLIIYEARPDVTIEAAAIALKAGNRILLKGGKEARNTNLLLTDLWHQALDENSAETSYVRYLDISREETQALIGGKAASFDLIIPRGGDALIEFVTTHSNAPVIVSGRGNNFLYIDSEADIDMAVAIAVDGKQRLSVCNALDKILIHKDLSGYSVKAKQLIDALREKEIEVFGDPTVREIDDSIRAVSDDMWREEFLTAKIVLGVVSDVEEAICKINEYSGGHSASIVTENTDAARRFLDEVDCAAVYHNASVRFTDGGEFGLGAEIAISTQKMHFRGPLGAEHLMTNKWFVYGSGQVRK
jgi:glutamate-5-semialdehyde dehydrogenase